MRITGDLKIRLQPAWPNYQTVSMCVSETRERPRMLGTDENAPRDYYQEAFDVRLEPADAEVLGRALLAYAEVVKAQARPT